MFDDSYASFAMPILWKKSSFPWISCTWLKVSPYCIRKIFLAFTRSFTSSIVSTLRSEFSFASKTSVNLSSSLPYSTEVSPYLRHVVARVDLGSDYDFADGQNAPEHLFCPAIVSILN